MDLKGQTIVRPNIFIHMKTSELTHIIKAIVAEEIKKQLPQALTEVFSSLMGGKTVMVEQKIAPVSVSEEEVEEQPEARQSLRELFASANPDLPVAPVAPPVKRNFTKNTVLNDILNVTQPFSGLARQQMGGMSPGAMMAAMNSGVSMGGESHIDASTVQMLAGRPPVLQEGQESDHIPLGHIQGQISALDLKQHAPPAVKAALSRNYAQMMKIIDKKRGKS